MNIVDIMNNYKSDRLIFGEVGNKVVVRDPIDNSHVFSDSTRDMLFNWCDENCTGRYWVGMGFGMFELQEDATLFKLRWS